MQEEPAESTPLQPAPAAVEPTPQSRRRGLRGIYDRLLGSTHSRMPGTDSPTPSPRLPSRIGRYLITREVGRGGMGIVYAARDERLGRIVALKTLSALVNDETGRKRFWREARAAASLSHPNICQIYEIGEAGDDLFIAMEFLEGESLSERLGRGALTVAETMPIALEILSALSALHAIGFVHRDLKPSNVFLTPHGVKVLDFGLARPIPSAGAQVQDTEANLTRTGLVLGTPRYMAPEMIAGEAVDARADLFAVGAILFEMLAGRAAFEGRTTVEVLHATLHEQPPALTGSPAIAAADRVIRRALAKRPAERPASAEAMAAELRTVQGTGGSSTPALASPLTRLMVLPFRILRSDPETDFLAFSLPDAIATSLSTIESLVVRSSATAARFGDSTDLKVIAAEADVDHVVTGTLLRSGDELRAAAQLVEAPTGTLLASHTVQSSLGDLFHLQDDVARRVVEALSLPLSGRAVRPSADTPRNARAYEFYLRGNDLARRGYDQIPMARDLYLQCVEQDPGFAPAWAHLGRCYLVIGKYIEDATGNLPRCEEALHRALELSPELPIAHKFYAHFEADQGRARQAVERLLGQASRRGNDPDLFAGLVHACRYCGLFEQSIAAHEEARRLDPHVPTSVEQTLMMAEDFDRLLSILDQNDPEQAIALTLMGRRDEARRVLREIRDQPAIPAYSTWMALIRAWIEERHEDLRAHMQAMDQMTEIRVVQDPESLFQEGWMLCQVGEHEMGLDRLRRGIAGGCVAAPTLERSPHFDALRGDPRFQELLLQAQTGRDAALAAFRAAGGERLLGKRSG